MRRGDLCIGDVFRNAARAVPSRTAAVLDDQKLSFAELDQLANRTAHALEMLGVGHGDRVTVWSSTSMDVVALFAALAKLGAVFVPIGAGLGADEAASVVDASNPALLLADAAHEPPAEAVAARAGVALASMTGITERAGRPLTALTSLARMADDVDDSDVDREAVAEDDPHVVFFTSGSTGRPKGAVLSHRVNYLRSHPGALLEPRGAAVCPYPLSHMGAWTIALQQWQSRDAVVLTPSTDARAVTEAVARHAATRLNAIPALWRRILDHPGADALLRSLRFADTGTSATPLELLRAIECVAPDAHLRVFYGSTEAGSVASLDHADMGRKPGSCGVPGPGVEIRVDDSGELWTRGPLLFDGYLDDDEATARVLVDGWYRTGDLAVVDEEGYLSIVGRAGELIRTGGESVAPAEVEAVLAQCTGVADVAVVGLDDPQWGEVVCACVVARPGSDPPTLERLRAHCHGRLASFKHPRRLVLVDSIPRTASTSQVQRRLLAEQVGGS